REIDRVTPNRNEVGGLGDHDEAVGARQGGGNETKDGDEGQTEFRVHAELVGNGRDLLRQTAGTFMFQPENSKQVSEVEASKIEGIPTRTVKETQGRERHVFLHSIFNFFQVSRLLPQARLNMSDDALLLQRCRSGDARAWDQLFDRFYPV